MVWSFFDELFTCFRNVVNMFFTSLDFDLDIPVGWILLAISVVYLIIHVVYGRIKKS